ncbi:hypothetical protein D3C72_1926300 [compost metagenome]
MLLNVLQQQGEVGQGLLVHGIAVGLGPGAAEQFLRGHLTQLYQGRIIHLCPFAVARVLGADAHQAYGLALQRAFQLLAQVRLWLVQTHPHFQPGLTLRVIEQVNHWQIGQLRKNLRQRRGSEALQVHSTWDQA